MSYILGFWYADGDMRHEKSYRLRFTSNDYEHLEDINKIASSNAPLYRMSRNGILENAYILSFHSKKLYQDLQKIGGRQTKSRILEFPEVPAEYLRDFIRGYFDGDGSVHKITYKATKNQKNYTEIRSNFTCGTKSFLERLRNILYENLGLAYRTIGQYGPHQFKLGYGQKDTSKLLNFMYYTNNPISLERKEKYLRIIESRR